MGRPGPLSVRINDGVTDLVVTRYVTGLTFTRSAPGGYRTAQLTVHLPLATFSDLGPGDRIWVHSARTGRVVWEGFIDNPGPTASASGESFDITALGTAVLASDQSKPLVYIDTDLSAWTQIKVGATATSATAAAAADPTLPDGTTNPPQGLLCQFPPGQPIPGQAVARIEYDALRDASMELGAIRVQTIGGKTDPNYSLDLITAGGPAAADSYQLGTLSTSRSDPIVRYVAGPSGAFAAGRSRVAYQLRRLGSGASGATNITDDTTYAWFGDVAVLGRRLRLDGTLTDATGMVAADYVQADWVAADVIARLIPVADLAASTVVTLDPATAYQIDQLTFPDGATADDVFTALENLEPTLLHEILESGPNGYRIAVRTWPTDVRYVITQRDGYEAPGTESDLCNRVTVYWTGANGARRSRVVTATSADYPALSALEQAGRTRDAPAVTLPDGKGSDANALRIGTQTLAAANMPGLAASVTVKHRVLDLATGSWVDPWEIEAGYLARIRETGDVMPITQTETTLDDRSTVLTLGYPVPDEAQRLAQISRRLPKTA